jgi:hypothetical protein
MNQRKKLPRALTFGAHGVREYFADVSPNDSPLGTSEKRDVPDQQPKQEAWVLIRERDEGDAGQANGCSLGNELK